MPSLKSISFEMTEYSCWVESVLHPHSCVIKKTPCGIGLNFAKIRAKTDFAQFLKVFIKSQYLNIS